MISICEPQCKVFSHEKVNSGFIYGLRLAYPREAIRFYGDASHIEALKKILAHDKVFIDNIEFVPIRFHTKPSLVRTIAYRRLLARIFGDILGRGMDKIFFLSFNSEILYAIKRLKQKRDFRVLKFTLVLHGAFESIANENDSQAEGSREVSFANEALFRKLQRTRLSEIPRKAAKFFVRKIDQLFSPWQAVSSRFLSERSMLLWQHSRDFRYICLSPHVRVNARRYIDVDYLNFHTVVLPTIFAPARPRPLNTHAKFAVFGYGNSSGLHYLLLRLSQRKIEKSYEIRIIGMDNRGTEGFANVICPSSGKPLDRKDMERYAFDIDMFLILYDKNRYRLSCSGSILESLSYLKPVLHLDNECVNEFNREEKPIGIRCDDLDELAAKIKYIAENYERYGSTLDTFQQNMLKVRDMYSIERSVSELKNSFTW